MKKILCLLVVLLMSMGMVSAVDLFSDDFESGDLSSWTIEDGSPTVTSDEPYLINGSFSAFFDGAGTNDKIATADINTTGYEEITVY